MSYRYLYIDDTKEQLEQGTINGLQDGGEIEVVFEKPNDWEVLLERITTNMHSYTGVILHLRLNGVPYIDHKKAQYRGSTVAQELRTLAKEGAFKNDFPIILISGDAEIAKSLDQTSLDLFDFCVNKNDLGQPNGLSYLGFRTKLKWLADGYHFLNSSDKNSETILNVKDSSFLDSRFLDEFQKLLSRPVHNIASFLIKQVIKRPSFLINEAYLSARLGIDTSSPDWATLLEKDLSQFKYTGAFSGYYNRWWMHGIESFWQGEISSEHPLRTINAEKRIELLSSKRDYKLSPLIKQGKSKSDLFWTVCKATHIAIDTIDGFVLANQDDLFPWQEKEYICIDEALRPTKSDHWGGVASLEKTRLQKLKDLYGKTEQRIRK
jgi:hypothetical protein